MERLLKVCCVLALSVLYQNQFINRGSKWHMAFRFTHALVAFRALQKLKRKEFSSFEHIDDFMFGSVAPDIRYLTKVGRRATHEPFGKKSAFEAFKGKGCSEAFVAGYESHLVCDAVWSGEHGGLDKDIYDFFKVDPNNPAAKFSLYFFVDDYFQGQSNWLFPLIFSGNVFRANETKALGLLNFSDAKITSFKMAAGLFLKEPGVNFVQALSLLRLPLEEKVISEMINSFTAADGYLKRFLDVSVAESAEAIQKHT